MEDHSLWKDIVTQKYGEVLEDAQRICWYIATAVWKSLRGVWELVKRRLPP